MVNIKNCLVLFLTFFVCSLNREIFSQNVPQYGSKEWYSLSVKERINSLEIPEDLLHKMKTEELIQAYIDYPLVGLVNAYNNNNMGFKAVYEQFNGVRELLSRKDVGSSLIKYYKKINPGEYNNSWTPQQQGYLVLKISYLELLIAQDEVINNLDNNNTKILIKELANKMETKFMNYDLYRDFGLSHTAFPLAKILYIKGKLNGYLEKLMKIERMDSLIKGGFASEKNFFELKDLALKFANIL